MQLERLELAFDSIKRQLFGQLHDVLRKQLFGGVDAENGTLQPTVLQNLLPQVSGDSSPMRNENSRSGSTTNGNLSSKSSTSESVPLVFEPVLSKIIEVETDPK